MKILYGLLLAVLISTGVTAWFYFSDTSVKNGFTRNNIYVAKQLQELDMKYNSYFICGLSQSRIFLGNYSAPLKLFSCAYSLTDTLYERIPFTYTTAVNWQLAKMRVDSPWIYLTEPKTPAMVSARLPFKDEKIHPVSNVDAEMIHALSPKSFIINGYDLELQQMALKKLWLQPWPSTKNKYRHQLQLSGSRSVDGFMLVNSNRKNTVLFVYYYRNQFVCLDTNLKVRYTGKTIDTNSIAKIKLLEIEKEGEKLRTMAHPPLIVNKRGYSSGNYIYIQSALIADNESPEIFKQYDVIDVYQLNDGRYCYSIYLPKHKDKKLTGFAVHNNALIALHERYLIKYSIRD